MSSYCTVHVIVPLHSFLPLLTFLPHSLLPSLSLSPSASPPPLPTSPPSPSYFLPSLLSLPPFPTPHNVSILYHQDRRTDPNIRQVPTIDAQQDWNLVAGSQAGGFTILEFSRPIDTGDTTGDLVIGPVWCCMVT